MPLQGGARLGSPRLRPLADALPGAPLRFRSGFTGRGSRGHADLARLLLARRRSSEARTVEAVFVTASAPPQAPDCSVGPSTDAARPAQRSPSRPWSCFWSFLQPMVRRQRTSPCPSRVRGEFSTFVRCGRPLRPIGCATEDPCRRPRRCEYDFRFGQAFSNRAPLSTV